MEDLQILAKKKNYTITERYVPGIGKQIVCLRPDGYEQVFYVHEDINSVNANSKASVEKMIRYEMENYMAFTHSSEKKQRFGVKDFTFKNIRNYIQGTVNEFKSKVISLPSFEKEQYEQRYDICSKCKHNIGTACDQNTISLDVNGLLASGCGCDFPGLTYAPHKTCPLGKWGELLNEAEYDKFKTNVDANKGKGSFEISSVEKNNNDELFLFEKAVINLPAIQEESGKLNIEFTGINNTDESIQIEKIITSCGCTASEYDKNVIKPNDSFVIKAVFDPKGRLGLNSKTLSVFYTNAKTDKLKFNITVYK